MRRILTILGITSLVLGIFSLVRITLTGYLVLPTIFSIAPINLNPFYFLVLSVLFLGISSYLKTFRLIAQVKSSQIERVEEEVKEIIEYFDLEEPLEIGKDPESVDFHLPYARVKRVYGRWSNLLAPIHFTLRRENGIVYLEHFGKNPTFIRREGKLIKVSGEKRVRLEEGDVITLLDGDIENVRERLSLSEIRIIKI